MVTMYADDTSISYSSRSVTDLTNAINSDLKDVSLWLQGNKLTLNVVMTQSMIFSTEPNLRRIFRDTSTSFPPFQINDDKIESTDNIKYLGLKIDSSLNWKEQVNKISSKISREIGMLTHSKRYLPLYTIQRMYNSIVDPHLRYCCSVWGCAGDSIIKKLQKLQNRATRVVTNSPNDQSSLPLALQLG